MKLKSNYKWLAAPVAAVLLMVLAGSAMAQDVRKLAIHVNSGDLKTQNLAINNAVNVMKHYGVGNVEIEIVAYGPGLTMFTKDSKVADRLRSLHAFGGVSFGVCGNTMKKMKIGKDGLLPDPFVQNGVVTSGVVRLIELQDQGYRYVKP